MNDSTPSTRRSYVHVVVHAARKLLSVANKCADAHGRVLYTSDPNHASPLACTMGILPKRGSKTSLGENPSVPSEMDDRAPTQVIAGSSAQRPTGAADEPTRIDPANAPLPVSPSDAPTLVEAPGTNLSNRSGQWKLANGTILGHRYQIICLLGQGGMGAVYKAKDLELNRVVALKVIRPELADDSEIIQRFKQELILAREVTHRNVIRIYDLHEADGLKFITMEFVEGKDLRTILRERARLPVSEAVEIIQQVCVALDAAHREGVIHRDLKPQNVMCDKSNRVLVMDFGLARTVSGEGMTQTGALVGTLEYMSPEQAEGKPLDQRSDLFTVGLILYELLTGKSPYQAESAVASLLKRTRESAVPLCDIDQSVPLVLSKTVSRCLERDPDRRYASAKELLDDLQKWQDRQAGGSRFLARARYAFSKPIARTYIAAGVAVIALLAAGWLLRMRLLTHVVADKPVSVLIADFKNGTGDAVLDGTLEPVFNTALEAAPFINSFKRGTAHRIAKQLQPTATVMNESVARLVAVREGVEVVISGSIDRLGSGYRLSADAVDASTGRKLASATQAVPTRDALLGAIGKIAAPIRRNLGDTTPESAQLQSEETFTTSSLEAAHDYSQATDFAENGKSNEAIQLWLNAVKEDPNMGRAYSNLAVASINAKKPQEAAEYYKRALSLLDRMSEREKYRTLGTYYSAFLHNYPQAIENYEKLTLLYPGDAPGFNNLSIAYVFSMDFSKALEAIKKAIEISPRSLQFHLNYALYSMYVGDFSTAANEAQFIIHENPSYRFAYLPLALSQLARGDSNGAQETYAKLEKIDAETASVANAGEADLEMYFGRYHRALETLEKGIASDQKEKNTGEMALKYVAKGEAHLALGQKAEAIRAAQQAFQLNADESVSYPAARILIASGRDAEALKIASTLDNTLQTQNRAYSQLIRGEIDIQKKQLPQAVEELRQGEKLRDSWISRFLLGRAYLEAGHFPEAVAEFENCKKRQGETADLMFADTATLHDLPPLYYWLAGAQRGAGMSAAAQENLQQFLKFRTDGDAGDPLVVDARKALGQSPHN